MNAFYLRFSQKVGPSLRMAFEMPGSRERHQDHVPRVRAVDEEVQDGCQAPSNKPLSGRQRWRSAATSGISPKRKAERGAEGALK